MSQPEMPLRVKAAHNFLHMIRSTRAAGVCGVEQVVTFEQPKSERAAIDSANRLLVQYFEGHIPDDNLGPLDRGPDIGGDPAKLDPHRPPMSDGGAGVTSGQGQSSENVTGAPPGWVPVNPVNQNRMID